MGFADSVPSGPTTAPATPCAPGASLPDGIARISAVASVFGAAHPKVLEVADAVAAAVREAAAAGPAEIVVPEGSGPEPDVRTPGGRVLRELAHLGVARVEFGADVGGPDLVAFAMIVRKEASPHTGASNFVAPELSSLPPTVRVVLRDFGRPTLDADSLPAPGNLPPVPLEAAAGETSIDGATRALLHKVVELAAREGTQPAADPAGAGVAERPANVREAVRAAAESLFRTLRRGAKPSERSIADIFGEAGRLLPTLLPAGDAGKLLDQLLRSLNEHMRDAFLTEERSARKMTPRKDKGPQEPGPPEEELAASIRSFTAGAQAFEAVAATDAAEDISIVLHVLGDGASGEGAEGVSRRLAAALARRAEEPERSVLAGWLRSAVGRLNPAGVDVVLAPVEAGIRTSAPGLFAQVLVDVCRAGGAGVSEALWPHLAREVLGSDDLRDAPARAALLGMLADVPRSRVLEEAPRLAALLGRRSGPVATSALSPPRPELFAVYEVLTDLPSEKASVRALSLAFSRQSAQFPPAAALGGLDPDDERARSLLLRMLRERRDAPELRAQAAGILAERLRSLPAERRDAPWVDAALRALGALPCPESDRFLDEVVSTRRWLVGWSWPPEARRTANEVVARRLREAGEEGR